MNNKPYLNTYLMGYGYGEKMFSKNKKKNIEEVQDDKGFHVILETLVAGGHLTLSRTWHLRVIRYCGQMCR